MAVGLEDLRVLQVAEEIADGVWAHVLTWDVFARDVVGKQITRSADSVGANIAESYGRYHYGEKLRFLYYARGSLFETKYWLNRAKSRQLLSADVTASYGAKLSDLAYQLNRFANSIKRQRSNTSITNRISEPSATYETDFDSIPERAFGEDGVLFSEDEISYLAE